MNRKNLTCLVWTACVVVLLAGCAGRAYLIVDYDLPPESQTLKGQTVMMVIRDLREDRTIFSATAGEQFPGFEDRYSLAWNTQDGTRVLVGEYDLENLFRQAFAKRLERLGVEVASASASYAPVFEVVLKKLKIDLRGRQWVADVVYEANLSRDSHLIAREKITGSAERLRVIGRKGADTVLSEIFSDIINRADIVKLFQQAKLI